MENTGEGCSQFRGLAYVPRIYVSADVLRVIRDIADKKVNTNPAKLTCTVVSVTPTRMHCMSNMSRSNDETANTIVTNVFGKIRIDAREILLLFQFKYHLSNVQTPTHSSRRLAPVISSPACLFLSRILDLYEEISWLISETGEKSWQIEGWEHANIRFCSRNIVKIHYNISMHPAFSLQWVC